MADAKVAVPITAGVVVHMGDHAFREGDTVALPPAHAAVLQGHVDAGTAKHEAAKAAIAAEADAAATAAPDAAA